MADQTNPPTPPPAPKKSNKELILEKLTAIQNKVRSLAGHPRFNPFMWYKNNVAKHEEAVNKGDESDALLKAISSIEVPEPPKVVAEAKE